MPARRRCASLDSNSSVPIPPSLVSSPYLNSPIFRREFSPPPPPSEQDELWLQDTIPLPSTSSSSTGSLASIHEHSPRDPRPLESRRPAPLSPPIIVSPRGQRQDTNQYPPNHPGSLPHNLDHHHSAHSNSSHSFPPFVPGPQHLGSSVRKSPSYPYSGAVRSRPSWPRHTSTRHSESDLARLARPEAVAAKVSPFR